MSSIAQVTKGGGRSGVTDLLWCCTVKGDAGAATRSATQRVNGPGLSAFLGYVLQKSLQQFIHAKKRWGHQRHGTWLREALPCNTDRRQAPLVPHAESRAWLRASTEPLQRRVCTPARTPQRWFSLPRERPLGFFLLKSLVFPFEILGISF